MLLLVTGIGITFCCSLLSFVAVGVVVPFAVADVVCSWSFVVVCCCGVLLLFGFIPGVVGVHCCFCRCVLSLLLLFVDSCCLLTVAVCG